MVDSKLVTNQIRETNFTVIKYVDVTIEISRHLG